jgi:pyruvate,orthophosphate dikinase
LDPPLHEFVPHTREEVDELAAHLGVRAEELQSKLDRLHEANPMLGHRGCRLAITYPEIYDMQVEAIALAAVDCVRQNIPVEPEIMIPIVVTARELKLLRPNAEAVLKRVFEGEGLELPPVHIGTMIEVPRAAIRSGHIARYADFFSFGTNDLTQMTFAFSRDDVASFLPAYLEKNVLDVDPFKSIDEEGVGDLIRFAIQEGRAVKPALKIGICGEHGGDPQTIDFCYRIGLSYVSCSPFRVPLARLAGAQAVINNSALDAENKTISQREAKSMSDAAKNPAARKPSVRKPAAKKTVAAKKPGRPAAKKTAAAKKPAARKPAVRKAAAAKKTVAAKRPAANKTAAAKKPAVRKAAAAKKTVAAKKPGRPAAKKAAAKKPTAKKPGRPAVKKASAADKKAPAKRGRPAGSKGTVKKTAADKKAPAKRGRPAGSKGTVKKAAADKKAPSRRGRPAGSKNAVKKPVFEEKSFDDFTGTVDTAPVDTVSSFPSWSDDTGGDNNNLD